MPPLPLATTAGDLVIDGMGTLGLFNSYLLNLITFSRFTAHGSVTGHPARSFAISGNLTWAARTTASIPPWNTLASMTRPILCLAVWSLVSCGATISSSAIVYYSDVDAPDQGQGIYVINADGSGLTNLTENQGFSMSPSWSKDGSKIVFASSRGGDFRIYVMNIDGTGQTRLTDGPGRDEMPTWSLDGRKIAFVSDRTGDREIFVMNADGSNPTNLTNDPGEDLEPSFSADGSRLAFSSSRSGTGKIYLMSSDGSNQTSWASGSAPSWSPDGSAIVYQVNGSGQSNIFVASVDGSNPTPLTSDGNYNAEPAWSPDGLRIAFWSPRDGYKEIYLMNADGTGTTRLTHNAGPSLQNFAPCWRGKPR